MTTRAYDELVASARRDENIVGLVLTGSRGRRFPVSDASDWDVRLVVNDDVCEEYRSRLATPHGSPVEVVVLSLSEFEQVGEVGTESAWDRYSYVYAEVVVDKAAALSSLVSAKSELSPQTARVLAAEHLDDYINAYYRAAKNARSGLAIEAHLDAAESIPCLLDFLFAAHGRVTPFNRFLRWELENYPLPGETWTAASLLPLVHEILVTGDIVVQQHVFRDVETFARAHGLEDVVDGWEPDLTWLRGNQPRPT